MALPSITAPGAVPDRSSDTSTQFANNADIFVAWMAGLPAEFAEFVPDLIELAAAANYSATSTTSLSIGAGTKSLTVETGKMFVAGQKVIIADIAAPGTNYMWGSVTAYNISTGALEVEIADAEDAFGSGTKTAWNVGLSSLKGVTVFGDIDDTPVNGVVDHAASSNWAYDHQNAAATHGATGAIVGTTNTQTLTGKTLTDPAIDGAIREEVFTITDGASVNIDPGNGTLQKWTLGANRTATVTGFAAGESVLLKVDDGSSRTLTISGATRVGDAITLATTGFTFVALWEDNDAVYYKGVGDTA